MQTPSIPHSFFIDLANALAWPVVTLIIAAVLRTPLTKFISALGSRITKLSVFKVELELTPAKAVSAVPLFDEIRSAANAASIQDSARAMLEQVQVNEPADYAEIALGKGDEWLTSRLYIATVMIERMRGVKALAFVESGASTERRFVAIAELNQLRWALACQFPWLEAAWLKALPVAVPNLGLDPQILADATPVFQSHTGAFTPTEARALAGTFISTLQGATPPAGTKADEWVDLGNGTFERAHWITRQLLVSLLPPQAIRAYVTELPAAPRSQRSRAVLRCRNSFVAIVDGARDFELVRVINRAAMLEEVATSVGEEPEPG